MEASEAAKVVYNRILETESDTITQKIMGYIYLQDYADRQLIRLAFGPDNLIQNLISKAKMELNLLLPIPPSLQILHSHRPLMLPYQDHLFEPFSREITSFGGDCYSLDGKRGRQEGIPTKICHYFSKGHCKHGNNCKFFHAQSLSDEVMVDDQAAFSPDSLEKLEFEITEILKSRRGNPISIASLPLIYYERYGRNLQAEGYLTESQRHGKAGYSLTKLLARLKNSIRLIDRPHGQHSVVLADDASRYMENRSNLNPGPIVNGSMQIYLTFPAESIFSEDDVANYFSSFGVVEDVRIPCQQKRMFGFVTFEDSETVQMVLSKGNPHYVCGARVLVKPYREKPKLCDRKDLHSHQMEMDHDVEARLEACRRRQLVEIGMMRLQLGARNEADKLASPKVMGEDKYDLLSYPYPYPYPYPHHQYQYQ